MDILRRFRAALAEVEPFDAASVHSAMETFASRELPPDAKGKANLGKLAPPIRVALTGTAVSPPLNEALAALGRERTLARIDRCLQVVR